jgi:sec-independent protein translocase protein TatC
MIFPLEFNLTSNLWYNTTIASFVISKILEDIIPPGVELLPLSWDAPLQVYVYVSLVIGVVISSPVIAYELRKFINPALHEHERKDFVPFVASFTSLFIFGFFLGYFLVMPVTVRVLLLSAEPFGLSPKYGFAQFFSLVAGGLLACGFVMTFPIYLILLTKAGIIKTEQYKKNRKYIYGALLIIISLIDPDPTLITEAFLGIPLIIILEVAVKIAHRFEKSSQ